MKALDNIENISSAIDLMSAYVAKAEVDIKLGCYETAIEDCEKALNVTNLCSNYYLLEKCKCLYLKIVANYKLNLKDELKKDLSDLYLNAKKLSENLMKTGLNYKLEFENELQNSDSIEDSLRNMQSFLNNFVKLDISL